MPTYNYIRKQAPFFFLRRCSCMQLYILLYIYILHVLIYIYSHSWNIYSCIYFVGVYMQLYIYIDRYIACSFICINPPLKCIHLLCACTHLTRRLLASYTPRTRLLYWYIPTLEIYTPLIHLLQYIHLLHTSYTPLILIYTHSWNIYTYSWLASRNSRRKKKGGKEILR